MSIKKSIPGLDLDKIDESGQCFRWQKTDRGYLIPLRGKRLTIQPAAPDCFSLNCSEAEFESTWKAYFDLNTDYAAINGRIDPEADPFLYAAMLDQRGIRILQQDTWEMLITSIITQNRNIPAIRRSVELLCAFGGDRCRDGAGREFHAFPSPEQILRMGDDLLSRCRLGYRQAYVRRTAEAVCSGQLNPEGLKTMPDEECRERLLSLYGVGEKVAACVLLFGLHRLNAFPRDVWINRVLKEQYPGGFPFDAYAPYNGIYQQYLFAYYRKVCRSEP